MWPSAPGEAARDESALLTFDLFDATLYRFPEIAPFRYVFPVHVSVIVVVIFRASPTNYVTDKNASSPSIKTLREYNIAANDEIKKYAMVS